MWILWASKSDGDLRCDLRMYLGAIIEMMFFYPCFGSNYKGFDNFIDSGHLAHFSHEFSLCFTLLCYNSSVFQFYFLTKFVVCRQPKEKVTKQFLFSFCLWTGESGMMIWIMDWIYGSSVQFMSEFGEVVSGPSVIWKLLHSIMICLIRFCSSPFWLDVHLCLLWLSSYCRASSKIWYNLVKWVAQSLALWTLALVLAVLLWWNSFGKGKNSHFSLYQWVLSFSLITLVLLYWF